MHSLRDGITLGNLCIWKKKIIIKQDQPKPLKPQTWQSERKGMKSDAKEKWLGRGKNNIPHPEMIMLKFGNVWVSSVTNSIMNTKRISNKFFILEVLFKVSMKELASLITDRITNNFSL